ncbi:LysR family transcriptional regulator [Cochlodiniinecator piscidefendens]|uniref:LysR family transcriptional regulator n=1 Tax=Cochlodiniinecator piscidefendens TaxID=2715756 RepID=UPI00140DC09D|nr:LysR substrate-binding domain-containing protein [Cochlodiniinecator piscidefendens]
MKITFRQLDAFRTVVSTGTVTEAANVLGISQPAASRLIADFESEVGFPLFRRSGRMLEPTEEARLLVGEIRQAISGMEHIKDAANAISQYSHARLRLITTPTYSTLIAPKLIRDFAHHHANAQIQLEVETADDTVEWMVSNGYDFGIISGKTTNPSLNSLKIWDEAAVCIMKPDHPLASSKEISAQDLANEAYVSYRSSSRFRMAIDAVFKTEGIHRKTQYEARTTDAICQMVANGLGVAIVGSTQVEPNSMQQCAAVPFTPTIPFTASLIWSQRKPLSAVAETFLKIAQNAVSD